MSEDFEQSVVSASGIVTYRYFEGELLKPVVGETLKQKVTRMAKVIANLNTYTRITRIKTLAAVMHMLDSWPLEELLLFEKMDWAHDSIDDSRYQHSIAQTVADLIYLRQQQAGI